MLANRENVAEPNFTKIGRVSPANISDVMVPSMPVQSRVPPVDGRSALAAAILSPAVTPLKPLQIRALLITAAEVEDEPATGACANSRALATSTNKAIPISRE